MAHNQQKCISSKVPIAGVSLFYSIQCIILISIRQFHNLRCKQLKKGLLEIIVSNIVSSSCIDRILLLIGA